VLHVRISCSWLVGWLMGVVGRETPTRESTKHESETDTEAWSHQWVEPVHLLRWRSWWMLW
jgi:hypothetical protein